ncbi:MAG: hypothetical protein ACU83U_03475 [Gammaproteobacteria bacterium]
MDDIDLEGGNNFFIIVNNKYDTVTRMHSVSINRAKYLPIFLSANLILSIPKPVTSATYRLHRQIFNPCKTCKTQIPEDYAGDKAIQNRCVPSATFLTAE